MSSNQSQVENIYSQYMGLSKLVRRLLISGIVAAIYALIDINFIQPMMKEYTGISNKIELAKKTSDIFSKQMLDLQNTSNSNQLETKQQELETLLVNIKLAEDSIKETTSSFVSPKEMQNFLNTLLVNSTDLTLLSMENIAPTQITIQTTKTIIKEVDEKSSRRTRPKQQTSQVLIGSDSVFKHGIRITLNGKYIDIANYVQKLELMPNHFFWESLSLKANYPKSEVTFELYTLSLEEDWLVL